MTVAEKTFHYIIKKLSKGCEGKMFGAKSIKLINGKTAAFLWKGNMVFKHDEQKQIEALKIEEAKIGHTFMH